jgi:hypothetical protein
MSLKEVKPKVITLNTPCIRNQRTLIWLQNQDQRDWTKWDAVVTSLEDYLKWYTRANIVGIIIKSMPQTDFYEQLFKISPHVPMILLSHKIFKTKSEEFWTENYDNLLQLDTIDEDYPYLGHPWDGTNEDAVALFAHLCRYNRIVDCHVSEKRMVTYNGNIQLEKEIVPSHAWLITQYFRHPDPSRAKEIMECLKKNVECTHIKTIILLTEKDCSKDFIHLKTSKIQQVIIKKRLTYAHFLQFVKDRVPKNTIAILANADIFMDNLLDLWRINLNRKMLALLRWDIKDSDLDTAELFGPRADSQDTWIVLSDSVKETDWAYEQLDVQLGQPGCDNVFAGQMLQHRFVLYNPALTLKTYHLHNTEIRNYTKADAIRAKLYVNLVPSYIIDTKHEKSDPIHFTTNELVSFEVKSSSISNEITYCTMLEKEGRYKWEPSVENHYFDEIALYKWQNVCVTPNGLVYTPYSIYPGNDEKYPYWKSSHVNIFTPLQEVNQMIAIPLEDTTVFQHPDTYILYYLSRILRLLKQYPHASFWAPKEYTACLLDYNVQNMVYVSNDTACYAKEVIGYIPGPAEIGKEEIQLLRDYLPHWKYTPVHKRCVIIGDYNKGIALLLDGWIVQFEEEASFDSLLGSALCIITTKNNTSWAKLWALPKETMVVEFQQELEVNGELQHLCHVCELKSWVILLSKGSVSQIQQQIVHELQRWMLKNKIKDYRNE